VESPQWVNKNRDDRWRRGVGQVLLDKRAWDAATFCALEGTHHRDCPKRSNSPLFGLGLVVKFILRRGDLTRRADVALVDHTEQA